MIRQCTMRTKKQRPCPINADRLHLGNWYCHVHDPEGLFQQQARAKRVHRKTRVRVPQ